MDHIAHGGTDGVSERGAHFAVAVLAFPLVYACYFMDVPGPLQCVLVIANSGLWGLVLARLCRAVAWKNKEEVR